MNAPGNPLVRAIDRCFSALIKNWTRRYTGTDDCLFCLFDNSRNQTLFRVAGAGKSCQLRDLEEYGRNRPVLNPGQGAKEVYFCGTAKIAILRQTESDLYCLP